MRRIAWMFFPVVCVPRGRLMGAQRTVRWRRAPIGRCPSSRAALAEHLPFGLHARRPGHRRGRPARRAESLLHRSRVVTDRPSIGYRSMSRSNSGSRAFDVSESIAGRPRSIEHAARRPLPMCAKRDSSAAGGCHWLPPRPWTPCGRVRPGCAWAIRFDCSPASLRLRSLGLASR